MQNGRISGGYCGTGFSAQLKGTHLQRRIYNRTDEEKSVAKNEPHKECVFSGQPEI